MWKVIIADDEIFIRDGLKQLIQWDDLECELIYCAKNGQDLLDSLKNSIPDIIILDIKMPVMDGLQVLDYLRKNYPQIKVILLTAYADFEYAKKAIQYCVNDYIVKTSILEEIPSAISKIVKELDENKRKEKIITQGENLFFRMMIQESSIPEDYYVECKKYYDSFEESFPSFCIILFQIINENAKLNESLQNNISGIIENIFSETVFRSFAVSQTEYCIIVEWKEEKKSKLMFLVNNFKTLCENFIGVKMLIGLSKFYSGIENISIAYNSILKEIIRNIDKSDNVFFCENSSKKIINRNDLSYLVDNIIQSIERENHEKSLEGLDELIKGYKESGLATVKSCLIVLLAGCRRIWGEQGLDLDDEIFKDRNIDLEILNTNNILVFKNIFTLIIDKTFNIITNQREIRHNLIRQINYYIDDNYCKRITLDEIAIAIHVNSSYLSRIYKLKTGKNLFDVINIKKIEKAKDYILNYNKKINEVANLVGFSDSAYFSRVFKKYTGITPKDFEKEKLEV